MTNSQVYSYWRILPIELELAVREVKWLQKLVEGGPAHDQLSGALFGELRVGGVRMYGALGGDGRLSTEASPYARKFISNREYFRPLDSAAEFFKKWGNTGETVTSLLDEEAIKEDVKMAVPPNSGRPSG